jgi:pimeloyl-ACP methyl ester carboxylesterase
MIELIPRESVMSRSSELLIRLILGQGGRLFPGFAGRAAFELFCRTSDPSKPNAKEKAAFERAAPIMNEARHHRLKVAKGCVVAHQFRAACGVPMLGKALVIHGWRSRTDLMAGMIKDLTDHGWDVVGLDLPGHGWSTGRRLNLKLGVEALQAATDWLGPFELVVGHSFGGAVGVNAVTGAIKGTKRLATARLVTISSPSSMPLLFAGVGRYFGLGKRAQAAMECRIHKLAGRPLKDFVSAEQIKAFDGEVLVIHAPDDREVDFSEALAMEKAGRHVKLVRAEGLGHRRILNDPGVFRAIRAFADGQLLIAAA